MYRRDPENFSDRKDTERTPQNTYQIEITLKTAPKPFGVKLNGYGFIRKVTFKAEARTLYEFQEKLLDLIG